MWLMWVIQTKKKILQIHANESCKALWGEYFILVDKSWSWHHVNTQYNNILTFTLIYRCFFILEAVRLQPPPFPLSWSQSQLSSVIHKPHCSQSKRQLIMFLVNTTQRCIIFIIKKTVYYQSVLCISSSFVNNPSFFVSSQGWFIREFFKCGSWSSRLSRFERETMDAGCSWYGVNLNYHTKQYWLNDYSQLLKTYWHIEALISSTVQ